MFQLASSVAPPKFSLGVFLTLVVVIAAGSVVFFFLTHRWTLDRRRAALADWAGEKRFRYLESARAQLPAAFGNLASLGARVDLVFIRGPVSILQMTTIAQPNSRELRWHVLLREMDRAWTPAGLRPVNQAAS